MADEYLEILIVARDLASGNVEQAQQKIDNALRRARQSAREAEQDFSHLDQTEQNLARSAENLGLSMERSGQGFVIHKQRAQESSQAMSDADRVAQRFESTITGLTGALDRNTAAHQRSSSATKQTERDLGQLASTALKAGGALVGIPVGLVGIGQAAAGAVGGVVALGAALSQLSALAVALPATLAGVAGSVGAIMTIARPALSPVFQAISGAEKLDAPGAAGTTGGGGGGAGGGAGQAQAVANAQRNLQQTQIQQGWQMVALEQQLHQLRMTNAQQEAQARQQLDQARVTAVQNVITLERQLHQLKESNAQQEAQLRQSLADAQASAAEEARTGGDHAAVAAGMVAQAQDNLTSFQQQAQVQQQTAQDAVDQARLQGIQSVTAAEQNLQQVRVQNAQQLDALQTQIDHTRITNAWALQSANQAVAQAHQAQATAATATSAAQQQQLALLKSMTPQQRELYQIITQIVDRWKELTQPGQQAFLGTAIAGARAVNQHLPGIAGVENQFSQQLAGAGNFGIQQFTNPQMDSRISGFMQQMAKDTGQVLHGMVLLAAAFTNFMTAPATRSFIQWMVDGVSGLGKWALAEEKLLERHGSLARFFSSSEGVIRNVWRILRDLAEILFNIGKAAAPTGRTLLGSIADFMDHLARETGSRQGMATLREFFEKAGPEAAALATAFVQIAGVLGALLQASQSAPPVLVWAVELLQWIAKVPGAGPLVGIAVQLALMAKFIPGVGAGLNIIVSGAGKLVGGLLVRLAASFLGLAAGATASEVAIAGLGFALDILLGPVGLIMLVVALVVLLYEAWTHNWFGIRDKTHEVLGWLSDHIGAWISDVAGFFVWLWHRLGALWDAISSDARGAWNWMNHNVFQPIGGWIDKYIVSPFSDLGDTLSGIWHDIRQGAVNGWNSILSTIGHYVNDIIDIWNWVVDHVPGMPSGLDIGHVTWGSGSNAPAPGGSRSATTRATAVHHRALGGFVPAVPGGVALVSEAGHDELVVTTDPAHMSRSLQLIWEWLQRMGLMPHFDIGGWLSSIGSDATAGLRSAWSAAENIASLASGPVGWIEDHWPHLPHMAGALGSFAMNAFSSIGDKVKDALIHKAESVLPFLGGGGSGNTHPPFVDPGLGESRTAMSAIQVALRQLGLPYVWGGDMPRTGFDCSGLVEYAYRMAGLSIPRTSEAQFGAGFPRVPFGQWLPGDLLYSQFPGDGAPPGHVTMYLGGGQVIEAPHTGANVEVAPLAWFTSPGIYVGANRPAPGAPRGRHALGGWTSGRQPMLSAGGWARAVSGLMGGPASSYGGAYSPVAMGMMSAGGGGGRQIHVEIPIYTSQVEADAEYVARTLEMRLQAMP